MKLEAVKAGADMAGAIGYVWAASWHAAYQGVVPEEYLAGITPETRAETFRKALAAPEQEFYLFYADGAAAGLAAVTKARDTDLPDSAGEIRAIYFLPDAWGKGYAREAMDFCLARLREMGFRQAALWVLEENRRARRFYEKYGFSWDGAKQEIRLGKPMMKIRYSMELPSGSR